MRQRLKSAWSTYHIDSEKICINEFINPTSPYVLMNYCGEPGLGENHLTKMLAAYAAVFQGIPMKDTIQLNGSDAAADAANVVVDPNPPSPRAVSLETTPIST